MPDTVKYGISNLTVIGSLSFLSSSFDSGEGVVVPVLCADADELWPRGGAVVLVHEPLLDRLELVCHRQGVE